MPKVLLGMSAVLFLSASVAFAAPDPADSVILESKTVAPQAGACQSAVLKVRVSITNKDSLANVTFPVLEQSLAGSAYAIISRPASCGARTLIQHVFNFLYPPGPGGGVRLPTRIASYSQYHSTPPDTFLFTGTLDDPFNDDGKVPPNPTRTPLLEIKFDSVVTSAPPGVGKFELDSGKIFSNTIAFVDLNGNTIRVNFVKSVITVGVPLEFNLISPANGALVLEQKPTLVWESLRDSMPIPATYTVYLGTNPSFSPADTSPPITDTMFQVAANLQFQTTYYWKVRAVSTNNDTVFSNETRNFKIDTPPTKPLDLYPSSGADISVNNYLVWLTGKDPDPGDLVTYQVQIDDNPNFSSPEVNQSGIDENTQPSPQAPLFLAADGNALAIQIKTFTDNDNLKDDSLYYWRVQTVDNHGSGSGYTSGTRNFYLNLADSSPRTPNAISPAGGIVLVNHRPAFVWHSTTDPDPEDTPSTLRYNVRLDADGEIILNYRFAFSTVPGETTSIILDSLAENGHWFWAVRGIDSKGARSAFSAIQNFYVNAVNEPPAAFSLLSPADDSFLVTRRPTLDWGDSPDPDPLDSASYVVAIDSFADFHTAFTSPPLFVSSYPVAAGVLKRGVEYFWKVTATDNHAASTTSNEVFRFRVLKLGDANKDGSLTPSDLVLILNFVYQGEPPIDPPELVDMDCDGLLTATDVVIALNVIFLGQSPPCDP